MLQKAIIGAIMAALLIPVLNRVGVELSATFATIADALQGHGLSATATAWKH